MNESKLRRTMSLTDVKTSSSIRDVVERDLTVPADRSKHRFFLNLPKHDLILPSLTRFDQDFRKFLLSDLVDFALLKDLEEARCLNWCPALRKFLPLLTMADGNCLTNAASLSMWAINDRRLTLRKSVYQVLIEDQTDTFKYRWQLEHAKLLEDQHGSPVDCSEEEWLQDWKNTVKLASTNKLEDTQCLSGLEEIHVFALSNVLRRPIIVLCDDILRGNQDESLASVNMGGIYLPLLSDSVDCVKAPILIGYNHGHFTALVTTEDGSTDVTGEEVLLRERIKNAVPLVKNNGAAMKIHFLLPEESQHSDRLLREYLNCLKVEYGGNETVLVAVMHSQEPEAHLDEMFKTYFDALQAVYLEKVTEKMSGGRLAFSTAISALPEPGGRHRQDTTLRWGKATHFSGASVPHPVAGNVQCCSAHQMCKTIGCENYTTRGHGLCHRCKEAEKHICTSPGCGFKADPDNQGLCSVCFARYRAILEQGSGTTGRPSAPPLNECRTENCKQPPNPNLHDLCLNCYLKTIRHLDSEHLNAEQSVNREISTQPAVAELPFDREPSKQHETSSRSTISSSPTTAAPVRRFSRQVSLFCSNPKCHNHLEDSGNQFCDNCIEVMASSIPPESNIRRCNLPGCSGVIKPGDSAAICTSCLNELQATNSSLEPLNTGSTSTFSVCRVSGCAMPAVTYHGELCLAHYKQSQNHHHGYNVPRNHDHSHDPCHEMHEAQGTKCINSGCTFYGNPENNYLCSYCHPKALQEQYDMELIKTEQERAHQEWNARSEMSALWSANRTAQFAYPDYQRQFDTRAGYSPRKPFYIQASSSNYQRQTSNSAPPSPNQHRRWPMVTNPCLTQGCPHFGTDQQKGLCDICFKHAYPSQTGRSRFCSTP